MLVSSPVAHRFILGRQGLWPGRHWTGKSGTAEALRDAGFIQMDPLNVIARNQDLSLYGRVIEYRSEYLDALMYADREFFEYGGNLRVYPMQELPYWRTSMRRKGQTARWAGLARPTAVSCGQSRKSCVPEDHLGIVISSARSGYRATGAGKRALALHHLWLTGEVMVHHRTGFERGYDFRRNVAPPALDFIAPIVEAERFFFRRVLRDLGLCSARSWARSASFFVERKIGREEADRWLERGIAAGEILQVDVEGEAEPVYLMGEDAPLLADVNDGRVPQGGGRSTQPLTKRRCSWLHWRR